MKRKYIEERYPAWFLFGESERTADISNDRGDVAENIPKEEARKIIGEHDRYREALVSMAMSWSASDPVGFDAYWYTFNGKR